MARDEADHRVEPLGPIVVLVAIQVWVLVLVGFLTPVSILPTWGGDLFHYQDVGRAFLSGQLPYRDFVYEYPPLALFPMSLPALAAPAREQFETYRWLFLLQNAAIGAALTAGLLLFTQRARFLAGGTAVVVALVLTWVAIAPLIAWRYDILIGFILVMALLAMTAGAPGLTGVVLGLGAMTKIYPAFLMPVFLVRHLARGEREAAIRLGAGFLATVGLIMLPFLLVAGADALQFVTWQIERGVQLESVPAGLTLLAHLMLGTPVDVTYTFAAQHVVSPLADALATGFLVVFVALLVWLWLVAYRSFRRQDRTVEGSWRLLVTVLLPVVLTVIVTNKVFSPQYLIWLLPLAAFRPMREVMLLAVICGLSLVIFPLNYERLVQLEPAMILLLNVRNALLVGWLIALLVHLRPTRGGTSTAPSAS